MLLLEYRDIRDWFLRLGVRDGYIMRRRCFFREDSRSEYLPEDDHGF